MLDIKASVYTVSIHLLPNINPFVLLFFIILSFPSPGAKNGVKGEAAASDDELTSDVLSHYSSASESTSVVEEGTGKYTLHNSFLLHVRSVWVRTIIF